jgi:hypothetical protein
MDTSNDRMKPRFWEASAAARQAFARATLAELLGMLFQPILPAGLIAEDYVTVVARMLQERINAVDGAWERGPVPRDARAQIVEAFTTLQACVRAVVANEPTPVTSMTMQIGLVPADGQAPRRILRGRLADGIVHMGLTLLSQVPRSLVRLCDVTDCDAVYVATKRQRYCPSHRTDVHYRARRRSSMAAFRTRRKDTTRPRKKRRTR